MDTEKIKRGLQLYRWGILLVLLSTSLHVGLRLPDLSWAGVLLACGGQVLALATPGAAGRPLLLASLLTVPGSLLLMSGALAGILLRAAPPGSILGLVLVSLAGQLVLLVGLLFFLGFLVQLACYVGRRDLAYQALTLALMGLGGLLGSTAGLLAVPELAMFFLLALAVVLLAAALALSGLLGRLAAALDRPGEPTGLAVPWRALGSVGVLVVLLGVLVALGRARPAPAPAVAPPPPRSEAPAERKGLVDAATPGLRVQPGARIYSASGGWTGTAVTDDGQIIRLREGGEIRGLGFSGRPPKTFFVDPHDPQVTLPTPGR